MGHGNQRPEIELVQAFMPVLVTSNFDDDSIKNEWASMETPFSHYKSMGNVLDLEAANSVASGPIWPKFKLIWDFMHIKRIRSKITEKRWQHHFPHYKSMGAFCCHGNQSFDSICPKTICSHSLTPMMLHIKFDEDWPPGFRDIQVQKREIFVTQGQVTPKWVVWFGPKLN